MADTVARLSAVVEARGMKVFAVIDHSGEAREVGLNLRETKLVIFGSPLALIPVIAAAPLAALDLPFASWSGRDQTLGATPKRRWTRRWALNTVRHWSPRCAFCWSGSRPLNEPRTYCARHSTIRTGVLPTSSRLRKRQVGNSSAGPESGLVQDGVKL